MHGQGPRSILHQIPYQCRYLALGPRRGGTFERLLEHLRVRFPEGLTVRNLIRSGVVVPRLSFQLPEAFFRAWPRFPVLPIPQEAANGHEWATALWMWETTPRGDWCLGEQEEWYLHPLDRAGFGLRDEVLKHARPAAAVEDARKIDVGNGREVHPGIHLFSYWQAYELQELSKALSLTGPIANAPDAMQEVTRFAANLQSFVDQSNQHIEGVRHEWQARGTVFEWVSLYRTAWGAATHSRGVERDLDDAARRLAHLFSLSTEKCESDLRDALVTLWDEWEWRDGGMFASPVQREHLREDLELAVDFVERAFAKTIEPSDPSWAGLVRALPYEDWEAKASFAEIAPIYLENARRVLAVKGALKWDDVGNTMRKGWELSPGFRRFVIAFHRLHAHLHGQGTDIGRFVRLTVETPMAFLTLCALETEKTLHEIHRLLFVGEGKAPRLNPLLLGQFERLLETLGIEHAGDMLDTRLSNASSLFDLPYTHRNPFAALTDLESHKQEEFLKRAFLNVLCLRNYAAHHDCLDDDLVYSGMAMAPIESMLVVLLLSLETWPTP